MRRFRPITLTAAAAVLALTRLLRSNFFGPMATALMGGITVATVLTLFFLPALYAAWFRVRLMSRQRRLRVNRTRLIGCDATGPGRAALAARRNAFAALVLGACAPVPARQTERAGVASAGYAAEALPEATVSAEGSRAAFYMGAQPVPQWWRQYGSDTLDAWVDEGLRNNASLDAVRHSWKPCSSNFARRSANRCCPSLDAGGQVSRQRAIGLPNFGPPTNLYNVYRR